ncbi:DUF445 domain-containing protein [Aquamicrobium segne]|uniref:DUF445 domain-containing protein n=1 Tax=Aquamicrobium segne TaxID=469547 RepID=A0ABW0H017_9HYPH
MAKLTATAGHDNRTLEDQAKIAALRRVKFMAAAALVCCVALFAIARILEKTYPVMGVVAAFAEAATIGGLADWYAVVALFRRPLGLPIPHTAIIPANQTRIADNLGHFIEVNFLAPGPVREKLRQADFSAQVADWLADEKRAAGLSRFVERLMPRMLTAIEQSGLRNFIGEHVRAELEKLPAAPLAAELLSTFTHDRGHQKLFDEIVRALSGLLSDEKTLVAMRDKIHEELPSIFNMFRADAYLLNKITASAASLLKDVNEDPDHPLREEFDRFVQGFIEELKTSEDYARRAEKLKHDLLMRPEMRGIIDLMWNSLRAFIEEGGKGRNTAIQAHLTGMFVAIGQHLARDPKVRADMNAGFVVALSGFVESQKSGVSAFIADQVKRWDLTQLTWLIEINIGKDLQYIRFNGMIVGGIAGVALYGFEKVFLS